jgi:hypothetical protein
MKNVLKLSAKKFVEEVEAYVEAQIAEAVAAKMAVLEAKYAKAAEKGKVVKIAASRKGTSYSFEPKACPVCGVLNRSRRTSFYCNAHLDQRPIKAEKVLALEVVPSAETIA